MVHNLQPSTQYSFVEAACTTAGCQTGGVAYVTTMDSGTYTLCIWIVCVCTCMCMGVCVLCVCCVYVVCVVCVCVLCVCACMRVCLCMYDLVLWVHVLWPSLLALRKENVSQHSVYKYT